MNRLVFTSRKYPKVSVRLESGVDIGAKHYDEIADKLKLDIDVSQFELYAVIDEKGKKLWRRKK